MWLSAGPRPRLRVAPGRRPWTRACSGETQCGPLRSSVGCRCRDEAADQESRDSVGPSRLEQIQEALKRGEAKAKARETAGEGERAGEGEEAVRLTPAQEQALQSLFVQPGEEEALDEEEQIDDAALEAELALTSAEYRINKTLEFCPDGVLARQLLREMVVNGTVPRAPVWTAVIEAHGGRDELDGALAVYGEMQQARVAATGETLDALARPAMRRGEFRFVETLYGAKASDGGGGIGAESLAILLEAYANGRPPQPEKAEGAFRFEMQIAQEEGLPASSVGSNAVLRALRLAVGLNQTCELCWEFGFDPALAL